MRWAPSTLAWCLLLAMAAHGQALLRYPGDRAQGGSTSSGTAAPSAFRIATIGDSNTEGFGLASVETYPTRLNNLLGATYTVDNYGVGGTTCSQVATRFSDVVRPRAYGVVLLMCGTNDLRLTADSAATIYARIAGIVSSVQATGARPVLLTVLPAGTAAGYTVDMEARRDALNALIRATSGVTVVDLDPLLQGAGEPPALSQTLDGLHLNNAGALTVATAVRNALTP